MMTVPPLLTILFKSLELLCFVCQAGARAKFEGLGSKVRGKGWE